MYIENSHNESRNEEEEMNEEEMQMEIWKRNIPLFYRMYLGHILEWGSLTC